jgi:hypothetical protein
MRLVVLVAVVAALALPTVAAAKGQIRGKVCGAAGCVPAGRAVLESFSTSTEPFSLVYAVARPRYLTVTLTSRHVRYAYLYVPAKEVLRVHDSTGTYWRPAPAFLVGALEPYVKRLGLLS